MKTIVVPQVKENKYFSILYQVTFILYIMVLLYLTIIKRLYWGSVTGILFDNYRLNSELYLHYNVNLMPFKTIIGYITHPPSINIAITNIVGNILAFLPLGFLTPFIIKRVQPLFLVMFCFSVSLAIEILQILLRVGSADVDDLILNTLGGFTGYLIFIMLINIRARVKRSFCGEN